MTSGATSGPASGAPVARRIRGSDPLGLRAPVQRLCSRAGNLVADDNYVPFLSREGDIGRRREIRSTIAFIAFVSVVTFTRD